MPYIITVTTPVAGSKVLTEGHQFAVATLDEARAAANDAIYRSEGEGTYTYLWQPFYAIADSLPDEGGTIGPLPDGAVIEVRRAEWAYFMPIEAIESGLYQEALDAYNEREAKSTEPR